MGINNFTLIIFFSLTLLVIGPETLAVESDVSQNAFSNPNQMIEMDKSWKQQALSYEGWAKGSDLAVTLDQHLYPALSPLIHKFAGERKIKINTKEGTCGISAGLIAKKHVDIGGFCCPPGLADRLPGLQFHTLGISALAILVNSKNPVDDLDAGVIRQIFNGKTTSWGQVPGNALKNFRNTIRVVGRLHCKQRPGHWRQILDNEDLFGIHLFEVGTINDMIKTIGKNPEAIGYEVFWNIERYGMKEKIKPLKVNGGNPRNKKDVVTRKYPFYRVYNITTWSEESGIENSIAKELTQYILANIDSVEQKFDIIPVNQLRVAGWNFLNDELIGKPDKTSQ